MSDGLRRIRILSDEPSREDLLGPHASIARAIADIIFGSEPEEGGKAILLAGERGSGKTTIVNLLENELQARGLRRKIPVFRFDAWVHQGEVLKRAFLERLIDFCIESNIVQTCKWRNRRKQMFCATSKVVPFPTVSAFVLLLLIAISVSMVSLIEGFDRSSLPFPAWLNECLLSKIILAPLAWLAIVALVGLYFLLLQGVARLRDKPEPSFQGCFWWPLRLGGTSTVASSVTLHEPQPTSIEFERHYRDLLSDAFRRKTRIPSSSACERLILVIDNLDRLGPREIKESWDELQLFCRPRDESLAKRVWLLVPMLPGKHTNDMLEKLCQVKWRIPDLVVSRWHDYFVRLIGMALPDFSDHTEIEAVYSIFYDLNPNSAGNPTPRQILLFVNGLAASYLVWGDKFPLRMIAWFTLLSMRGTDIPDMLRTPEDKDVKAGIPHEIIGQAWSAYGWRGPLAALHYGLEINAAVQMYLGRIIREAIESVE